MELPIVEKYLKFFKLNKDFTIDELRNAKNEKVNSISVLNLSDDDKQFYIENIYKLYKTAKIHLQNKMFRNNNMLSNSFHNILNNNMLNNTMLNNNMSNQINRQISNVFNNIKQSYNLFGKQNYAVSESKSYQEKLLPDGNKEVVEVICKNNNGIEEQKINTYKLTPDGRKIQNPI